MTAAPFRCLRVGLFGFAILALAAAGHLAAGGQLPGPSVLAALAAITCAPVVVLTRFKLSFPLLLLVLGAGQLVLHTVFAALSALGPVGSPMPGMSMRVDHADPRGTELSALMSAIMPGTGAHSVTDMGWNSAMLIGHVLATVATALVLARGEQALWNLIQWLRPLLGFPSPPVRVDAPAIPAGCVPPAPRVCRGQWRLPALRGPPPGARVT